MFQIVRYMWGKRAQYHHIAAQQKPFLVIQLLQIKIESRHRQGFIHFFVGKMDDGKFFVQHVADQLVSLLADLLNVFRTSGTGSKKKKNQKGRQGALDKIFHIFTNQEG